MSWEETVEKLKARAQAMHEAREAGLTLCRKLVQVSSKTIRHTHRHEFEEAARLLGEARAIADAARAALADHPELYHAGYLTDAEKEFVEAAAVLAIVHNRQYPTPEELGVGLVPYLHGMGEAASEVRRYALDEVRKGSYEKAENILSQMEGIYDDLITFDYPDGMTGALRRTTDALRAVIERTRSDLTATFVQQKLVEELQKTRRSIEG